MVYVVNLDGTPLMPCKERKARKLLEANRAEIYKREPFTIRLLWQCESYTQPISLGIDPGSTYVGLSATTEKKELFAADVILRNDISKLISERSEYRRNRRNDLRYREPRFDNRVHSKKEGWLAPSVNHKINTHIDVINMVTEILPITDFFLEIANFDIQKIKNPETEGKDYQQGEQFGFWNVREYVLWRDNHECQCCKGKSKDPILNVHHIESRQTGGDAPNNLITLCETCHKKYHKGEISLPEDIHRGMSFRHATFMNIMRKFLYNRLKKMFPNVNIHLTYGYITKNTRIEHVLPKEHYVDARCISGHPDAEPLGYYYLFKKVRRHNRKIHKGNFLKGGKKKANQAPYKVFGFRLFDKVICDGQVGFITGRRQSGYFKVCTADGKVISESISYKKLKFVSTCKGYLIEKRPQNG